MGPSTAEALAPQPDPEIQNVNTNIAKRIFALKLCKLDDETSSLTATTVSPEARNPHLQPLNPQEETATKRLESKTPIP